MQANPDKYQAIVLGKLGFENCKRLNIGGSTIQCEETVKLLGVTFDYMLNFEAHIANICKKTARQINVLLRLSNVLNQETKILIYKSFIYSNFNYCPLVWHFCSKASTDKLEKLQYRAVRLPSRHRTSDRRCIMVGVWSSRRVTWLPRRSDVLFSRHTYNFNTTYFSGCVLVMAIRNFFTMLTGRRSDVYIDIVFGTEINTQRKTGTVCILRFCRFLNSPPFPVIPFYLPISGDGSI